MPKAVIDADYVKYSAAAAGETRSIHVVHKTTGDEYDFKTRTEFYGGQKKDGGVLATLNKSRTSPMEVSEFIITDVQTPEPLPNVLHLSKMMMEKLIRSAQADSYKAFLGAGDSFRVERSTLLKYKGQRQDLLRPVYLEEVADYIQRTYNAEIIRGIEADDRCVMECYTDPASVLIGVDKDYYGCPVNLLNPNKLEDGVVKCNQFGKLYKDAKGKVRGYGRLFLYHQVCSGDAIDNYKANSASSVKWGEASSFKALVDCKNDKEAWEAMKKVYQKLYPEPSMFVGWRGDRIEVDWLYALRENFDLARMLRFDGDEVDAKDVLIKMGLL